MRLAEAAIGAPVGADVQVIRRPCLPSRSDDAGLYWGWRTTRAANIPSGRLPTVPAMARHSPLVLPKAVVSAAAQSPKPSGFD